jgi:hypothetical protein
MFLYPRLKLQRNKSLRRNIELLKVERNIITCFYIPYENIESWTEIQKNKTYII